MSGPRADQETTVQELGFHPLIVGAECPALQRSRQGSVLGIVSIPSLSGLSVRLKEALAKRNQELCFHPLIVGAECPAAEYRRARWAARSVSIPSLSGLSVRPPRALGSPFGSAEEFPSPHCRG